MIYNDINDQVFTFNHIIYDIYTYISCVHVVFTSCWNKSMLMFTVCTLRPRFIEYMPTWLIFYWSVYIVIWIHYSLIVGLYALTDWPVCFQQIPMITRQHSTQSVGNMPPPSPRHLLPHILQIMPRNPKYDQFQPKGHYNEENPQSTTKMPGNPKFYRFTKSK